MRRSVRKALAESPVRKSGAVLNTFRQFEVAPSPLLLKLAASVNPGAGSGATNPPVTAKREGGKA